MNNFGVHHNFEKETWNLTQFVTNCVKFAFLLHQNIDNSTKIWYSCLKVTQSVTFCVTSKCFLFDGAAPRRFCTHDSDTTGSRSYPEDGGVRPRVFLPLAFHPQQADQ